MAFPDASVAPEQRAPCPWGSTLVGASPIARSWQTGDMTAAQDDLLGLLALQPVGELRFRGISAEADGWDAVYGGHFLGQATAAACATVTPDRQIHSLHAYFLKAGVATEAIDYDVTVVREGRSFCTRRVTASQSLHGRGDVGGRVTNFELTASFAVPETGADDRGRPAGGLLRPA